MNADEKRQLDGAGGNKDGLFTFSESTLTEIGKLSNKEAAHTLVNRFISNPSKELLFGIERFLDSPTLKGKKESRISNYKLKRAIVTILQSPEYQLC